MPRAAAINSTFNAGELSPRMAGRVGTEVYAAGCHRMENFIPDIAGPAVKRGGTQYVAAVKDSATRAWLVRFQLSAAESYMLEFGDGYIRFFYDRAPVLSFGVPYEIVSPYAAADLVNADGGFALDYVQSGDIIYLVHRDFKPRKLSRLGATSWTLSEYDPTGGPFKDTNITTTTVYASAATGAGITLTASASIFASTDVGTLFYLEQKTVSAVQQWEPAKAIGGAGVMRRSGSRNYLSTNAATTGTVTPTHTEGSVYDGDGGVQWQFLEAGYGWVRITGYTSATQVTADVLSRLPDGCVLVGNATTKWAFGAWSEVEGYPDSVTFYLDRLVFARDQWVWMTVAGDYENMQAREAGRQLTDSAIALPIPSRRGNSIHWLETLESGLVVGTGADEWLVSPASRNEPLGPLNVSALPLGAIGSRNVPPVRLFDSIVFCQRSGRRLRGVRYIQGDGAGYADLNAYADHITSGFTSLAYVAEPHSMIWGTGSDGDLSAVTYYPEQNVMGWARFPMTGAVVECVQSIPDPHGRFDELWLIVRRTIDGATARYVEVMRHPLADDADQEDAFYVDSGVTYTGSATTTITGLSHLEGETVAVLTDGATHPQRMVSSGSITLQRTASTVHVGLPYTATVAGMDLEAGAGNGTAQGKVKRIYRIAVRLLRTLGGQAGTAADKLDTLQFRDATVAMGSAPPLFTGDKSFPAPGGSDRVARPWFVHADPLPATVIAFMPQIQTEDA